MNYFILCLLFLFLLVHFFLICTSSIEQLSRPVPPLPPLPIFIRILVSAVTTLLLLFTQQVLFTQHLPAAAPHQVFSNAGLLAQGFAITTVLICTSARLLAHTFVAGAYATFVFLEL
jgi:hypothetical protein